MNVSVYPFKEGSTCPGQFFKGAPEYEACFVRREEYWMVDRQSVMFTSHPATDDMIVDIRQQGNGPRTQKFSIKRSEIYDAEGKFMIEECLPANCRAYTFNRFGKAHFLTVKSRPDGTVETRFIVNAGGESHITYLPRATRDQQRRAYYFQDEERRKRYEALGYGQIKLRQCYPED